MGNFRFGKNCSQICFRFKKSFYLSEQVDCDLTYRELITDLNYPNYETILRAFTRFTYLLHERGIQFLDHSPGNTLIKKIVTRSWKLHEQSNSKDTLQDFVTINKVAVTMRAHNHSVNKNKFLTK